MKKSITITRAFLMSYMLPSIQKVFAFKYSLNVKATAYVNDDKVLISLGNFDTGNVTVRLMIDWDKLGVDASGYTLVAPEIANFQPAARFSPDDEIPVKAKEGWLLILEK